MPTPARVGCPSPLGLTPTPIYSLDHKDTAINSNATWIGAHACLNMVHTASISYILCNIIMMNGCFSSYVAKLVYFLHVHGYALPHYDYIYHIQVFVFLLEDTL